MRTTRSGRNIKRHNRFEGGMMENISPLLSSASDSPFMQNCDTSTLGELKKLPGFTQTGTIGSSGRVKGVGIYEKEDGTNTLMKVHTTSLYKWTGSAWSSIYSSFTNNSTDKAVMVNAYIYDAERK